MRAAKTLAHMTVQAPEPLLLTYGISALHGPYDLTFVLHKAQGSYRILGRGYFSSSLFAENKYTEIEGRGSHLEW